MAAITPNTTIYLLTGVPLDPTYDHSLWFDTAANQASYFIGKAAHTLSAYTYQRAGSNIIKVQKKAEQIMNCNYLMFKNTSYGSETVPAKWFYAFITDIEYINDETSAIYYEIDLLQTWFFDYTLDYCFVERNHTLTDNLGEYIEPEPVAPGEYVANGSYVPLKPDLTTLVVIIATCELTSDYDGGKVYDGIFGASRLVFYNTTTSNGRDALNSYLASFADKPQAINGIYMVPLAMLPPSVRESTWAALDNFASGQAYTINGTTLTGSESLNGYTPKNKKLYMYPFNFYSVDNANGGNLILRYEFFDKINGSYTPSFKIMGNLTQPVRVVLRPYAYKFMTSAGGSEEPATDHLQTITLENYPLCSWAIDSYNAWVAQNAVPEAIKTVGTAAAGLLIGGVTGGIGGAVAAGAGIAGKALGGAALASSVAGTLSKMYSASIQADLSVGNFNNGSVNCSLNTQNFFACRMSITRERARCIDDFFSRFGYALNRLMIPSIHARTQWTYVKTAGCTITGSIPARAAQMICSLYDAGITFWANPANVGNYGLTNGTLPLPG